MNHFNVPLFKLNVTSRKLTSFRLVLISTKKPISLNNLITFFLTRSTCPLTLHKTNSLRRYKDHKHDRIQILTNSQISTSS